MATPSARETFTPHELSAAYKDFEKRGAEYLNAQNGLRIAAYRLGAQMLIVYDEPETGLVVLTHPTSGREFPPEVGFTL